MIEKISTKHHYLKKKNFGDYIHAKKVFEGSEIKNLGENHDLHVQDSTLLLADELENFRNMCLKI